MLATAVLTTFTLAVSVSALFGGESQGQGGGYGAPSGGYEAPSGGYGAPSGGYGAPSGGSEAPSGGYGAPSGGYGAPSGGYGAPSGGYGAPSGGYGVPQGPVYAYQSSEGGGGGGGGGGLGGLLLLKKLLPLKLLALGIPLALLALSLPVTTTLIGGRRKRESPGNMTLAEKQAEILHSYLDVHGLQHNMDLQKEMIARYLECGSSSEVSSCLQRLSCALQDPSLDLHTRDKEVAYIIIETIMGNEFISKVFKRGLENAGEVGLRYPGSCSKFPCQNSFFAETRENLL